MPEPIGDVDKYGLSMIARAWTPAGMVTTDEGRRLLEGLADMLADAMNPLIEFEQYAPIILDPSRCLDEDLFRILDANGIDTRNVVISFDKQRRLAILAPTMREWRGAFRSHRIVASALTGGAVILRSWIILRVILDISSMDLLLLPASTEETTDIFVLGQGPDASQFNETELLARLDELAKPVLDTLTVIPCFALTAWRNGLGTWQHAGTSVLVASTITNEFEALDMGPDVDASSEQWIRTPTTKTDYDNLGVETTWVTVFFKTDSVTLNDYWEVMVYADDVAPDGGGTGNAYVARINVRSGTTTFHRLLAGTYGASFGSHVFNVSDGLDVSYHRVDVLVIQQLTKVRMRVYVDHNPSAWYDDVVVPGSRPTGVNCFAGLRPANFSTGTLRIAALTARVQD